MTVIDIFERIFGWDICVKMNSSRAVFEWQPDYTLQRQWEKCCYFAKLVPSDWLNFDYFGCTVLAAWG